MTAVKQLPGITAPDGSEYIVITDGAGNTIVPSGLKQLPGAYSPDGGIYVCPTDGNGTPTFGGAKRPGLFAPDGSVYVAFISENSNLQITTGGFIANTINVDLGVYIINGLPVTFVYTPAPVSFIISQVSDPIITQGGNNWIVQ